MTQNWTKKITTKMKMTKYLKKKDLKNDNVYVEKI